jgi:hypothetical protein
MPWAWSNSFNLRFSSTNASRSRDDWEKVSFSRRTSCSRALMYNSLRSRCVLQAKSVMANPLGAKDNTFVLDGLAPACVSWRVCCQASVLFSWVLAHLGESLVQHNCLLWQGRKPRVVFFSPMFLKNPKLASGLLEVVDSLPIKCHCPLLSRSDPKSAKLSLRLPGMLISEKHSDVRREAGEGYSTTRPVGG